MGFSICILNYASTILTHSSRCYLTRQQFSYFFQFAHKDYVVFIYSSLLSLPRQLSILHYYFVDATESPCIAAGLPLYKHMRTRPSCLCCFLSAYLFSRQSVIFLRTYFPIRTPLSHYEISSNLFRESGLPQPLFRCHFRFSRQLQQNKILAIKIYVQKLRYYLYILYLIVKRIQK